MNLALSVGLGRKLSVAGFVPQRAQTGLENYLRVPLGSTCTTAWRCICTSTPVASSTLR